MRPLRLLTLCTAVSLAAAPVSLQQLTEAAAHSDAAKARQYAAEAGTLQQRSELLTDGIALDAQAGYADAKNSADSAMEYRFIAAKPFRTASTGNLERLLGQGTGITATMETARLQNGVYAYYVDACALQEDLWLLQDARERGRQMGRLIRTGMEGGEFDRSAWLRSRLNVQNLTTEMLTVQSRYRETLLLLGAAAQTTVTEPLCSDLPATIPLAPVSRFDEAPLLQQLDNRLERANALATYRNTWLQEVTLAAGYDDEMDVRRGSLYVRLPLSIGERRENDREAARRDALAAAAERTAMRIELKARIEVFASAQQTRRRNLRRLNDILIPEAYETTVLLEERFMGSEASYLEYIESQKALFALLREGVRLHAEALKAEAELFAYLGITPTTHKDTK